MIGGIAMFCGFLFAVLLSDGPLTQFRPLFAGSALLVIVGVLDDFRELPAWTRFAAQIAAALIMALWGGVVVSDLGRLLGADSIALGAWSIPFTVFGVVGVINAVNMADGMDGLAGSLVLSTLVLLAVMAHVAGLNQAVQILVTLAAVVCAFLLFNLRLPGRKRAAVFMGDAGSLFLGYTLAWFLVDLSQAPARAIAPVSALWMFALPLVDAVGIMIRRVLVGRSPFSPDREHLHHVLTVAGLSPMGVVGAMLALSLLLGAVGVLGFFRGLPETALFSGFLAVFALYFWAVQRFWRLQRIVVST